MIWYPVEQGSHQWVLARLGVPTASAFDHIITPKTQRLSSQADKYARTLIAEQILRAPMDDFLTTGFMLRGNSMEAEALGWYELTRDVDTQPGGFAMRDDRIAGASADFLVGTDGLGEVKCPSPEQHIAYLLDVDGIGYKYQVQGQLWVYEREWNDTISYHPGMPKAEVRQYRDEKFIATLATLVRQFHEHVHDLKAKLQAHGLFEGDVPELRVMRSDDPAAPRPMGGAHVKLANPREIMTVTAAHQRGEASR